MPSTRLARLPSRCLIAGAALSLAACSDAPDPEDYGGGEMGEIIARCVERVEGLPEDISRAQAETFCNCFTERVTGNLETALGGGGLPLGDARQSTAACLTEAEITFD